MKTEKLKAMIKHTLDTYNVNIPDEHVDYILDLCDNNYELELERVLEANRRVNTVFIKALGVKKFNEIKKEIENK